MQGTGTGRVLANPKVRVMSGRKANFVSETQMPILTRNGDGEINTEWKNVGISLEMLPVVLDDGEIHITVTPRASSIVGEKRLGDVSAPIISERRVETQMILHPMETIVIGGLINDRDIKNMSKVPILGDIPLFGELFKSTTNETERSTVIVFLRPNIVESYSGSGLPADLADKYKELTVDIKPIQKKPEAPKEPETLKEPEAPEEPEVLEEPETSEEPAKAPRRSEEEYESKWNALVESLKKTETKEPEKPEEKPKEPEAKPEKEPEAKPGPEAKPEEPAWVPPLK